MKKSVILIFALILLFIIPFSFAEENNTILESGQADIYVDGSAVIDGDGSISNPYKYLNTSVMNDNSIIHIANGEYSITGSKSINNISFIGQSRDNTILKHTGQLFSVNNFLSLKNLTLISASIKNYATVNITNCVMKNSVAPSADSYSNSYGGAIYNLNDKSVLNINNCIFKNNTAQYGGAIYAKGTVYIFNSIFENNYAYRYGGAVASENNIKLTVDNTQFISDYSLHDAGGAVYAKVSTVDITNSNFTNCNSTFGAALTLLNSNSTINNIIAADNNANYDGGAIYTLYGNLIVENSKFNTNKANNGAGIFSDNTTSLIVQLNSLNNNFAVLSGNAIYTLCNSKSTIRSNTYGKDDDVVESDSINLFIGNNNYTMFKGSFDFNGSLPSQYRLSDEYLTPVKNQETSGNCWAFTAVAVLESSILKATGTEFDLSEGNMKNVMSLYSDYGWNRNTNIGGYNEMALGYLTSWLGPVLESDDLTDDKSILSPVLDSILHVQNFEYIQRNSYTDNDKIKEAILKYGAVGTSMYYSSAYLKGYAYYNSVVTNANHAVTIVGWDDSYSKSNFKTAPAGDGAFIVRNSWGSSWGDHGYFYVSYYDIKIAPLGNYKGSYAIILNDTIKYDKNYQYDIIGLTDIFITGGQSVYYQNLFTANNNEYLAAFSTYFTQDTNWEAKIYVNDNLKLTQSGFNTLGYYTIDLNELITLKSGDVFKIQIHANVDNNASFPICEYVSGNKLTYKEGISFFSTDGKIWNDLYQYNHTYPGHTYSSQVACIKAFTIHDKLSSTITLSKVTTGVNINFNLVATLKDNYGNPVKRGKVIFKVNEKTMTANVNNGKATITTSINTAGIFTATAIFESNGFNLSTVSSNVIVKGNPNLKLNIPDITYGEKAIATVSFEGESNAVLTVNNKDYTVSKSGSVTINEILNVGKYSATLKYDETVVYASQEITVTFNVLKVNITCNITNEVSSKDVTITVTLSQKISDKLTINVNNNDYAVDVVNGRAVLELSDLNSGNYQVALKYSSPGYNMISSASQFRIYDLYTNIGASDIVMYYKEGSRYSVKLTDENSKVLANKTLYITIQGVTYTRVTDGNGETSLPLNLNSGLYNVSVVFNGEGNYLKSSKSNLVTIKSTIIANDIVKMYRNATQFHATVLDKNGNLLKDTDVIININGVMYTRTTDFNGTVTMNINLNPGVYILTLINPVNEEMGSGTVKVLSTLTDNNDLTKYYKNASRYSLRVLDDKGNPLANASVVYNINGMFYTRTTDAEGIASLAINLNPGNYIITAEYNGLRVSNKIKVLTVLSASDIKMEYRDGTKFKVTLLNGAGKVYSNQEITFNINGLFYKRTTDDNGVASLNINLMQGKYIITSSYNGLNMANTITIS